MKKILFATTALVAASMIASSAMADGFAGSKKSGSSMSSKQVKATSEMKAAAPATKSAFNIGVSGFSNWYGGYIDNDKDSDEYGYSSNSFDVMGDTEIHFDFDTVLSNGIKVGGHVELEGGTDEKSSDRTIDQSYVFVESKYGKLVAGRHDGVDKQMHKSAFDVGALDIQETDFTRLVFDPSNMGYFGMDATYINVDDDLTKISYFSPKFYGLQAGVTYAPAASSTNGNYDATSTRDGTDATIFALGYEGAYRDFGFALTGAYGFNTGYDIAGEIPNSDQYSVGGRVMWKGFTVSSGYKFIDFNDNQGKVIDMGVAYEQGPYGVSLSYINGKITDAEGDIVQDTLLLSAKYNLAAGVDSFATFGMGSYKGYYVDAANNIDEHRKNKGWALIGGMMLSF